MSQHPAAEIVAIALRKIQKVANNRKYQALLDECQAFLDNINTIFSGPGKTTAQANATSAAASPAVTQQASAANPGVAEAQADQDEKTPTSVVSDQPSPKNDSASHAADKTVEAVEDATAHPGPSTPKASEVKAHFADEDLAEARPASYSAHTDTVQGATTGSSKTETAKVLPDLVPRTESALPDAVAAQIIAIMRSAINTERPNIIEVAIDCIQKLIAFKFLQGAVYGLNVEKQGLGDSKDAEKHGVSADDPCTKTPQAQAIELMCRCDEISDEGVELCVLKGLLTAATAATFTLHGQALLLAVRACYNIYLTSRSDVNQTTAKATLTQMLNVVFQRMEADDVLVEVKPIVLADMLGMGRAATLQDAAAQVISNVQSFLNNVVMVAGPAQGPEQLRHSVSAAFLADQAPEPMPSSASFTKSAETNKPSAVKPALPASRHHRKSSDALSMPAQPTSSSSAVPTGRHGLVLNPVLQTPEQQARSQVLQQDAYVVFRALCKLSIRTSDQVTSQDPAATRGKVLALELLKVLLENSGPTFRRSEKFISAIRQYLCLSLLKNSASSVPAALQLSCSILLSLLSKFRTHLKAEVGVFFPMMLLKPFEPQQGPGGGVAGPVVGAASIGQTTGPPPTPAILQYRITILRVMAEVCRNGQLLVDLFVNYDCDLESSNLFERMVNVLVRLAQQPPMSPVPSALVGDAGSVYHQEAALRLEALQALVNLVEAMLHWYRLTVNLVEMDYNTTVSDSSTAITSAAATTAASNSQLDTSSSNLKDLGDEPVTAGSVTTAGTAAADAGGDDINAKRAYKAKFQEGISLFNKKPKKGIEFLQREGMLGRDVADVAIFLLNTQQGLDKTTIGDYLGERDDFHIKVMHAYVDMLDFTDLEFDAAIRLFLSGFRLPGEAQKIDRLMEKFAERYLKCNPGSFRSADVAYVLAYSVIMLNTDLHNTQVKNKMDKEGFLRNNRGINDGQDLPAEFLSALYDRIATNEIKMKEEGELSVDPAGGNQAKSMFTTLLSLMGAFKQEHHAEPSEESIKRTLDYLHEKAKGSVAVTVSEPEAVRPMMEAIWAPLLGALSVLFDEYMDVRPISICLQGISASCCLTALVGMTALRDVFIHSLCGFTHLHSPQTMRLKNALAFQYLLRVASPDNIGDHLDDQWVEVLRCISRWELLQQISSGMPTDAALFAGATDKGIKAVIKKAFRDDDASTNTMRSIESLGMSEASIKKLHIGGHTAKKTADDIQVPAEIINSFDTKELSAVFVNSSLLNSESVVAFVRALCLVSYDELESTRTPRIFSMTRLVEVAHFNMTRIRLVWSRIWAVLSDYFIHVGCHANLQVAMYAVDSLRQLAMKFLERDELANYTFQNDFLRPFVVVMRQSQAVEIRELIIRCLSQMVLARVDNVKSGWKSMFMVFTTAAGDKEQMIVNLAFDTIEKIVREHFNHITETETTTFTDCVNCLIAFTNNPHSSTVALNSIAFLRYCAVKLAEGAIGDVNELPEGVNGKMPHHHALRVVALDNALSDTGSPSQSFTTAGSSLDDQAKPLQQQGLQGPGSGVAATDQPTVMPAAVRSNSTRTSKTPHLRSTAQDSGSRQGSLRPGGLDLALKFEDRDEHVYFWFPLLAGLSELTFDPRDQIRNSALEVLFDTLKTHGGTFAASFWRRVFDSVLMPIFDHVRAEVTDTTTFTSEKRREKEDSWLYETCRRCLQHLIDVFVMFYDETSSLLPQLLSLLSSFINRSHQSLAAGGVYALAHLTNSAAPRLNTSAWNTITSFFVTISQDTAPNAEELVTPPVRAQQAPLVSTGSEQAVQNGHGSGVIAQTAEESNQGPGTTFDSQADSISASGGRAGLPPAGKRPIATTSYSLREGIGARRLAKFRCQSHVQLLLVQSCGEIYIGQHHVMPGSAINNLLSALENIATHSRTVDSNAALRKRLAMQQAEDRVPDDRVVYDPPLLRLETEAAHAYLSVLLHINTFAQGADAVRVCNAPKRMAALCRAILTRFALGCDRNRIKPDTQYMADAVAKHQQLQAQAHAGAIEGDRGSGAKGGFLGMQIGGKSAEAQRRQAQYAAAVAAATQGRTADQRSIIIGRTSAGVLVLMAAPTVEFAPFTTLINSTLAALNAFDEATFKAHLHEFFPLLTALISADYAPAEVLRTLAELFAKRVGPIIGIAQAEAAAEMAHAAATARVQAEQHVQMILQQEHAQVGHQQLPHTEPTAGIVA